MVLKNKKIWIACSVRLFDILISLIGLTFLLLPIFTCMILIGPSPIFKQERIGLNSRKFMLFKLRTMHLKNTHVGQVYLNNDSVTGLGRVLRRWKIDELPQLLNVLRGDMSIVGPRPLMDLGAVDFDLVNVRNSVRPGLTGLSQVSGNIHLSLDEKIKLDVKMIEDFSVFAYFYYICYTVVVIFVGERRTGTK